MMPNQDNHSSSRFQLLLVVALATINSVNSRYLQVEAHGTMIDPVSRNSLWRLDGSAPLNYDDTELFCGGIGVSRGMIKMKTQTEALS